jgi:CheY-like chemotaxis protein
LSPCLSFVVYSDRIDCVTWREHVRAWSECVHPGLTRNTPLRVGLALAEAPRVYSLSPRYDAPVEEKVVGASYRILLVEDEEDDIIMMTQLLQSVMHHEAAVARTGLEAIRMAQSEQYDLVLLDLILPHLQGFEVARSLRRMDSYRDVPIIALTAYDTLEARERSLEAGCDEFLTKPVNIDRLIRLISNLLHRRRNSR